MAACVNKVADYFFACDLRGLFLITVYHPVFARPTSSAFLSILVNGPFLYVPVLNYCNVSMFYNSCFMRHFTSTCFILVQFIKYVLWDCLYMWVNVNGIYYAHVCEQARSRVRSAGNSAIENLCIIDTLWWRKQFVLCLLNGPVIHVVLT